MSINFISQLHKSVIQYPPICYDIHLSMHHGRRDKLHMSKQIPALPSLILPQ